MTVRRAKTQISLGIRPVWSESSLCIQWVAEDSGFLHADSEDSDQTAQVDLSLRWAHRHFFCFVVFRGGSNEIRRNFLRIASWTGSDICLTEKVWVHRNNAHYAMLFLNDNKYRWINENQCKQRNYMIVPYVYYKGFLPWVSSCVLRQYYCNTIDHNICLHNGYRVVPTTKSTLNVVSF